MEQRIQGKAGLPFFLLTFSLAKQRKSKELSAKPDDVNKKTEFKQNRKKPNEIIQHRSPPR